MLAWERMQHAPWLGQGQHQPLQCRHPTWHDSLHPGPRAQPPPAVSGMLLHSSAQLSSTAACRHPTWHDSLNLGCPANMTTMLVDMLESYGFSGALGSDDWNAQPVFLESFEVGNLKYAASITDIPLIQLLDEATTKVPDLTTTYSRWGALLPRQLQAPHLQP